MGRALGINAVLAAAIETTYGTTPATGFVKLAMVSHGLGEEQPLLEDDQLGFGREGLDPTYDVISADGDLVVPVNTKGIGFWLRQTFGAPVTSGPTTGLYTHTFASGGAVIPSSSIEVGNPEVPSYSMNYGQAVNQLKIGLARSGMLNAALSMIGQGEIDPATTSAAGTPTALAGPRFAQSTGAVTADGEALGNVVAANIAFSNDLDKVEVIRADGRIAGVDPGPTRFNGDIQIRFADQVLLNKARGKTPIALTFGWTNGTASLIFASPRVFLPKPKRQISGPKGIVATFNFQGSGQNAPKLTAALVNDVVSY